MTLPDAVTLLGKWPVEDLSRAGAAWLVGGFAAALLVQPFARWAHGRGLVRRSRTTGVDVPTGAGLVLSLAGLLALGLIALQGETRDETWLGLLCATGAACVGFLDDVLGNERNKGLRGHLRALGEGDLTTGTFKLAALGAIALVVLSARTGETGVPLVLRAVTMAAWTNVLNMMDLAPARAVKAYFFLLAPVLLAGGANTPFHAALLGALAVVGSHDARARLMLGDAGSNLLGAVLGFELASFDRLATALAWGAAAVAIVFAGERVSLSVVISGVPLFRRLDEWGTAADREGNR